MRPILFHIGPVEVPSFFLMVTIGALAMTFAAAHMAKREGLKEVVMLDFGIIGMTVGIIGAKLFHVIFENPSFYAVNPWRILYLWQGGFVSIGAFVSTIIGWVVYLKVNKLDVWRYLDIAALFSPVIIFFTRLGCFLAGCCYGLPTNLPWGVVFPPGSHAGNHYPNTPLHPTQVYFMLNAVILALVLSLTFRYRKFYGQVSAAFFMYYGISRFLIEFARSSIERGLYFGMPAAQISMAVSVVVGIIIWTTRRRHLIEHE